MPRCRRTTGSHPTQKRSVEQHIAESLYVLETQVDLDVLRHFDTTAELLEKAADPLGDALARRVRGGRPPFVLRGHVALGRPRALASPG